MAIKIKHELGLDVWRKYVLDHPAGNIFHTPEMFQVLEHAKKHAPRLWVAVDEEGPLALMTPVHVAQFRGPIRKLTSRGISYGSVLFTESAIGREALMLLLSEYRKAAKRELVYTELRNISDMSDVQQVFEKEKFIFSPHYNYLIPLDMPSEEIFQKIGKRTRKHIRRGLRRGDVEVVPVKSRDQISTCYELLSKTYQAAHIPLADRSLFEAAYDILSPKNMVWFTIAYVDKKPGAVSIELAYKNVLYGWYGGVDRQFAAHVPNEKLMWNILEKGSKEGFRTYDFGGAGTPDQEYGVRDFKAKFGGELVSFGRFTCIHSKFLYELNRRCYKIYRRFKNS